MGLWNFSGYPWYKGMGAYSVMKGWDWFGLILKREATIGLVSGRHEMPVDDYVWEGPLTGGLKEHLGRLYAEAVNWLKKNHKGEEIHLYVTGYSPALTAFLRAWRNFGKAKLTLYHYDIESQSYEAEVWRE